LLQREGWELNHKRVELLWRYEEMSGSYISPLFTIAGLIRSDNGPEFTEKTVRYWLEWLEVQTLFILWKTSFSTWVMMKSCK